MRYSKLIALSVVAALAAPVAASTPVLGQSASDSERTGRERSAIAVAGLYAGLYGYTAMAWYFGKEVSPTFQWRDEGWFGKDTYAGGADKLGHLWGNYALVRGGTQILRGGGWDPRASLWVSTALSAGFFTLSEIQDGYHGYGFAVNDMYANGIGILLANIMERSPALDRSVSLRMQYFPSQAFINDAVENGPFNSPEDYSGQTILLSYHLAELPGVKTARSLGWMRALDVSIGYEAIGYLPERDQPRQNLFLGLSLNMERLVFGSNQPARSVSRLVQKLYAPPLTVLRPWAADPFQGSTMSTQTGQ